ncbi:hypothetical protein JKP75_13245 [Blastococcus sp. TML/M2B]|uniref:PD-(D/E)XK nuclease family protein n=1 Tax=unclassified Blastococcus TaxID=2619396 RepID=UPI00190DFF1F|nr:MULTISPECIES: PD-(D/E)XK nuclease family protein [unclassified Blastococcus]MBN1093443.1 hypothetical protein [Blastococcus sp. TML/M2B]MBN1096440.1 hypothetical protein [Blastococcus sp. TML/C7B]
MSTAARAITGRRILGRAQYRAALHRGTAPAPGQIWIAGRLTTAAGTERCPHMFYDDEELARSSQVGVLVHATIGTLAARTRTPTAAELRIAADRAMHMFAPIEARAHRQNIASLTGSYFWHLLPPPGWLFAGTELDVGVGRIDLLWRDRDDRVLIDEIKAGSPRGISLARTSAQVTRYGDCATRLWPDQFIGIRLLSLTEPHRSVFVRSDGGRMPLFHTDVVTRRK